MVTIQFPLNEELHKKIMKLKNSFEWSWEDCCKELLKRCEDEIH